MSGPADSSLKKIVLALEAISYGVNPPLTPVNITGGTNAAPIVLTTDAHSIPVGNVAIVDVASVGGLTNANGRWMIVSLSTTTVSLLGSQGNSAYTSGGTMTHAAWEQTITDESLKDDLGKVRSKALRSDGQPAQQQVVDENATCTLSTELQYKEYDWLLAAVQRNTWVTYGHRGVGAAFTGTTSGGNTLTASSAPTGASAFTNLKKGQWVLPGGMSTSANNVLAQISLTTAPTSTVLVFEGTPFGTNGAMGAACTISGARLTNGTTKMSFALERWFTDISKVQPSNGHMVDSLTATATIGDILSAVFNLKGKSVGAFLSATALPTAASPQTYEVMSPVTGVSKIQRAGVTLTESFMKLDFTATSGVRPRKALGSRGPTSMGLSTFGLTGNSEAYTEDGTRFGLYINNTAFSQTFALLDSSGNGYIFTIPRARFTDANPSGGGQNNDVTDPGAWDAEYDSTQTDSALLKTLIIDRVGVAV